MLLVLHILHPRLAHAEDESIHCSDGVAMRPFVKLLWRLVRANYLFIYLFIYLLFIYLFINVHKYKTCENKSPKATACH